MHTMCKTYKKLLYHIVSMRKLKNFENKPRGTPEFPCALYKVDSLYPDYIMPFHWHAEYEIILIRQGKMEITANDVTYTAQGGDVLFLSDGVLHGGTPEGNDCVYDCVVFAGELLTKNTSLKPVKDIFRHGRSVKTFIPGNQYPDVSKAAKRLCDALSPAAAQTIHSGFASAMEYTEVTGLGIMLELLGMILKYGLCTDGYSETNRHILKLKKTLAYMEEHYPEKITLSELASEAGVTPKYLCRSFCSLTGKTPVQYLNEYRIDCACEMLRSTDKTLLDIAVSCGFGDQSYFVKWFRRLKGITPKCYRNGPRQ